MVCGYYLSRCDDEAYRKLGYPTQQATHEALGRILGVPAESIKNWRDEFDPIHPNSRQGWHRREMYPSRRRTVEAFGDMTITELSRLIQHLMASPWGSQADLIVAAVTEGDNEGDGGGFGLRGPTGAAAEEAFRRYHFSTGQPIAGTLVDRRLDQCGYDFEVHSNTDIVMIEVKGLVGSTGGITFTDREWSTARERGDAYFLALVRNVSDEPQVALIRNPGAVFQATLRTYTTVQICWSVAQSELRRGVGDSTSDSREPDGGQVP